MAYLRYDERTMQISGDLTYPAEDSRASRCVGVEDGHHGTDRGVEGRASIEPEPAEPDQYRS